eukprot:TRINITY_DN12509_c0_g1_i1.p1 TRINITY_DN12509_c0_g1~~TRINITY_DN12509_c0_g1_i1.p1  ORF type:complete len:1285 (-),score=299.51 TRINITY_DN12509_c0_g1_i1:152-4006(-)
MAADSTEAGAQQDRGGSEGPHIVVAVRFRPPNERELSEGGSERALKATSSQQLLLRFKGEDVRYSFDHVLGEDTNQAQLFELLGRPQLEKTCEGYNSTIFAYGQTGSGKTHTMLNVHGTEEEKGLIPRLSRSLFLRVAELRQQRPSTQFLVQCSFLEIYNEVIHDLLAPGSRDSHRGKGLEIREQKGLGVYVKDLTEEVVEHPDRLDQMIHEGFTQRSTAATAMNSASSRSHCVFTIRLHQKDATDSSRNTICKLNLVDLAGSERSDVDVARSQLKEGANINKSLSALSNVIKALSLQAESGSKRKAFVPYRDSKLTRVLQESLGGNSLCTMIATVSPVESSAEETWSTLQYAKRAKTIRVAATRNDEAAQRSEIMKEVDVLRQAAQQASTLREQEELETRHRAELQELEAFLQQSWEDKQRLTREHDAQREEARLQAQRATQQLRIEQQRRLEMLENHGDLAMTLQSLVALDSRSQDLCLGWPEQLSSALRLGQQLQTQLRTVRLYRDSAAADVNALALQNGNHNSSSSMLFLSQVQAKLQVLDKELEVLQQLEAGHSEQFCALVPEVTLALKDVSQAQDSSVTEEEANLVSLVQRQMGQRYAAEAQGLEREAQQLGFTAELAQLQRSLAELGMTPKDEPLLAEMDCVEPPSFAEAEGPETSLSGLMPVVLGLSTLAVPDERLVASSNTHMARSARLLRTLGGGGWSPTSCTGSEEFLELNLQGEHIPVLFGILLQGRLPASGRWQQTLGLLQLVLGKEDAALRQAQERTFLRPPVRCVHEVAVALVCKQKCFGQGGWQPSDSMLTYTSLSKEQKAEFFSELIRQTSHPSGRSPEEVPALELTAQDILAGRKCAETNRLLQLLACRLLGLGLAVPQWTTKWRLQCWSEESACWCWYGASGEQKHSAAEAWLFEGNKDAHSVRFVALPQPLRVSKIRIYPVEWHVRPALRLEALVLDQEAATKLPTGPLCKMGRSVASRLKAQLSLVQRAAEVLKRRAEADLSLERQEKEREVQERSELQTQLQEALARAASAEAMLLQARAEWERLQETVDLGRADLALAEEARVAAERLGADLHKERAQLQGVVEELGAQLQVVCDERDAARLQEEKLFYVIAEKDEELLHAQKSLADLTERLEEKELHDDAAELFGDEMAQVHQQLQDAQVAHSEALRHCQQLEEENRSLRAERDRLSRKKEKLAAEKQELKDTLKISEQARQAARDRCEQLLRRAASTKRQSVVAETNAHGHPIRLTQPSSVQGPSLCLAASVAFLRLCVMIRFAFGGAA